MDPGRYFKEHILLGYPGKVVHAILSMISWSVMIWVIYALLLKITGHGPLLEQIIILLLTVGIPLLVGLYKKIGTIEKDLQCLRREFQEFKVEMREGMKEVKAEIRETKKHLHAIDLRLARLET